VKAVSEGWVASNVKLSYASHVVRSWVKLIWSSLGVAVLAAAAQLAVAQALGIVRWTDHYEASGAGSWNALLTWMVFIYALAVLSGATVGRRAVRRPGRSDGGWARAMAALAAAVGAGAAIVLAMLQARAAVPPVNVHPELVVSVMAGAGVLAGLVITLVVLSVPPMSGGVRTYAVWVWLAAIGSTAYGLLSGGTYRSPQLALVQTTYLDGLQFWPGSYMMIISAAVLGLGVALVARWGGAHRLAIALSGLAGPGLVAGAYALANADLNDASLLSSLYAVAAGGVASTLVALPRRDQPREETGPIDPMWGEADRYRPGNYLAEARPADIPSPFRSSGFAETPGQRPPTRAANEPRPAPQPLYPDYQASGSRHRADEGPTDVGYGSTSYLGRQYSSDLDYPTDEYPTTTGSASSAAPDPASGVIGQPPSSFEDTRSDWLRNLGTPAPRP
jgi:hypothetical protein